ncbi:nucleotidyltransferase substrate binding protein [Paucibacter sp. XJ19-41]|uniref:nucleotidyltransferase substrate binding protein n=1 Tax=Paucibacter sp. XJ19-41 TaxID=2927824 RepID=UPI00234B6EF1|nr:nucleotidyltransferase substrate binding protein [Paucibacter sp. XJ19-41]MDC6168439.1 nucleotidyltransferase substrate binding protein [Paucibacter sp. XJ19-41]
MTTSEGGGKEMALDLTSLSNAVQRLQEGLARYQSDISDTQIRDGLIQRFEFTYELAHKMLKRYLESAAADPTEFDVADFQYLIRSGNEQGLLLSPWAQWRHYRDMRAKTSHTYDEATALLVVASIPEFLDEARYLLQQLQTRAGE